MDTVKKELVTQKPWESEPDLVTYNLGRYYCLIRRHPSLKHLCGYVGVIKSHPYYEKEYHSIEIDVHGGLTFSDFIEEYPGYWFLGFDCAHLGDFIPSDLGFFQNMNAMIEPRKRYEYYRTISYVGKELENMVYQLQRKENSHG